jgi:hypothetical protein
MGEVAEQVETLTDLMTEQQVARMFNRSPLTVRVWRKQNGMPYVLIPGDVRHGLRFRYKRLMAWAEATGRASLVDTVWVAKWKGECSNAKRQ